MGDFFEFIRSLIIKGLVACILYVVFGVIALIIFGDDAQLSMTGSGIVFVAIVVLSVIIGDKISNKMR